MSRHRSAQHLAVLIAVALAGAEGAALAEDVSGRQVYVDHCASCHGANLEGQPHWKRRLPTGRLPAPPHDATGHTWHHSDRQLFRIVKEGPAAMMPGYETDMPGFGAVLDDGEIAAVLDYIKSTWPERQRDVQAAKSASDPLRP
ncbi:c-type cytochrome [Devosia rhizoryzae]|uniref:Cytochrome c n=1 Tax=Devosia rhizoryzae TaxID=2774137 RepID=A0ABX7C8D7_9HYPH|nr:cytochrome c [Devosia rhizoryzae]QQR40063.1 cytochrome c [Devosia rhizoryzae]